MVDVVGQYKEAESLHREHDQYKGEEAAYAYALHGIAYAAHLVT